MCVGKGGWCCARGVAPSQVRVRRDIVQNTGVNMGENGKML